MSRKDSNKNNLQYFEAGTMPGLFRKMKAWQNKQRKRLLSVSIQQDGGKFCCIALTNPTEVTIVDSSGENVWVLDHALYVCR